MFENCYIPVAAMDNGRCECQPTPHKEPQHGQVYRKVLAQCGNVGVTQCIVFLGAFDCYVHWHV